VEDVPESSNMRALLAAEILAVRDTGEACGDRAVREIEQIHDARRGKTLPCGSRTKTGGRAGGLVTAAGTLTGLSLWAVAGALGLSTLVQASQIGYDALRLLGAAYLVWLGVASLRARPGGSDAAAKEPGEGAGSRPTGQVSRRRMYVMGSLSNLLNPKIGVFFIAFLPGFIPSGASVGPASATLGLLFVVETGLWLVLLSPAGRSYIGTWMCAAGGGCCRWESGSLDAALRRKRRVSAAGKDSRRNRLGLWVRWIYRCGMEGDGQVGESVARRYAALRPYLDERQRRLVLGAEAAELGRGGIKTVARGTGVHPDTVAKGVAELDGGVEPSGPVRAPGGGRKPATETDPGLEPALMGLVDPVTRGDPCSPLVWTTKSTKNLADTLAAGGHPVSDRTVARVLRGQGFSLQANAKVTEGRQHIDRDAQFSYLNAQVIEHLAVGAPVISVDTKKKELVGEFHNGGREYQPTGCPVRVNVHDFPDPELGKAIPYGIYDVAANTGWVSVGADHDTSAFAVATLRRWWNTVGCHRYPHADRLLICADGGGSNGYRVRAWKIELAHFAAETGLGITVCHLPPGTSKWNKIEHVCPERRVGAM